MLVLPGANGPVMVTLLPAATPLGADPSIMPATGTPEPGGLSWTEMTRLLRTTAERRRIVGADIVELSPIPGMVAPNFLCAKLLYKLLTYRFARDARAKRL